MASASGRLTTLGEMPLLITINHVMRDNDRVEAPRPVLSQWDQGF